MKIVEQEEIKLKELYKDDLLFGIIDHQRNSNFIKDDVTRIFFFCTERSMTLGFTIRSIEVNFKKIEKEAAHRRIEKVTKK